MERWLEHVIEEFQLAAADKERLAEITEAIQYMEDRDLIPHDVSAELFASMEYVEPKDTDYSEETMPLDFGE